MLNCRNDKEGKGAGAQGSYRQIDVGHLQRKAIGLPKDVGQFQGSSTCHTTASQGVSQGATAAGTPATLAAPSTLLSGDAGAPQAHKKSVADANEHWSVVTTVGGEEADESV